MFFWLLLCFSTGGSRPGCGSLRCFVLVSGFEGGSSLVCLHEEPILQVKVGEEDKEGGGQGEVEGEEGQGGGERE